MPKIGEKIYKKVDLITEGAFVEILTNPKGDAWDGVSQSGQEEATGMLLSKIIKSWNFTDDTGAIAPLTPQNITAALSNFDIAKIFDVLGVSDLMLSEAKKNNSTSISSPAESQPLPSNT